MSRGAGLAAQAAALAIRADRAQRAKRDRLKHEAIRAKLEEIAQELKA